MKAVRLLIEKKFVKMPAEGVKRWVHIYKIGTDGKPFARWRGPADFSRKTTAWKDWLGEVTGDEFRFRSERANVEFSKKYKMINRTYADRSTEAINSRSTMYAFYDNVSAAVIANRSFPFV